MKVTVQVLLLVILIIPLCDTLEYICVLRLLIDKDCKLQFGGENSLQQQLRFQSLSL